MKYLATQPITNGLGEAAREGDDSWPRYIRTTDIASPTSLDPEKRVTLPPDVAAGAILRRNDLLLCAAGSLGKTYLHLSDEPACYAGYLVRFRPDTSVVDPRFVSYWSQSQPFTDQVSLGAVRSTIDNFSAGKYQNMMLDTPALMEQQRVADFLDDQIVLFNHAIGLRSRQEVLAKSKAWSWFDTVVDASTASPTSLNRYLSFTADGPFGSAFSSSDYTAGGPAVIRLGNISFAQFRGDDLARVPVEIWQRFPRCQVQPGDLLIASLGDANNHAGRACLAPDDLGPAIVKGKCFRARVDTTAADPTFLALAMSSPRGAELFSLETRGATRSMINLDILGAVRLLVPDLATQRAIAVEATRLRQEERRQSALIRRAIDLLVERKQALITAAVTGQLDVTTARSGLSVDAP